MSKASESADTIWPAGPDIQLPESKAPYKEAAYKVCRTWPKTQCSTFQADHSRDIVTFAQTPGQSWVSAQILTSLTVDMMLRSPYT